MPSDLCGYIPIYPFFPFFFSFYFPDAFPLCCCFSSLSLTCSPWSPSQQSAALTDQFGSQTLSGWGSPRGSKFWRAGGAGRLWLELRVKGGLEWHNLCFAWQGEWGKDKGSRMPYLRSRFSGQHAAAQLVIAWAWRADYLHPSSLGCSV